MLLVLVAFGMLVTGTARAQDDPPGRVGRLAELQGTVWWWDHQRGQWDEAQRNYPLTGGDRVSTGADGRAELRVGSTALRIGAGTEIEVLRLDDERMVFQLHSGDLALRVRSREVADEIEVLTAEARLLPQRAGHYRIGRIDDVTLAGVWRGDLQVDGGAGFVVTTGQTVELSRGARSSGLQRSFITPPADEFSSWAQSEDLRDARSVYSRHVSPEMTGAEDLDRNGRWVEHPDYGTVWEPLSVAADWAPYRYGQWAWVAPWGWTWVDTAPWGFAPFHYGRWVNWRSRWAWVPGAYVVRPVYAPALVAWIGGPHVGVSVRIGGPSVGWLPLAPREIYLPEYRHGPRYRDRVNAPWPGHRPGHRPEHEAPGRGPGYAPEHPRDPRPGHPRQVPTGPIAYDNQGVPGAVTTVPRDALLQNRPNAGDTRPSRPGRRAPDATVVESPRNASPSIPAAPVMAPMPAVIAAPAAPAAPAATGFIGPARGDRSARQAPSPESRPPRSDPLRDGPAADAGAGIVTSGPQRSEAPRERGRSEERMQRPERSPVMRERGNLR